MSKQPSSHENGNLFYTPEDTTRQLEDFDSQGNAQSPLSITQRLHPQPVSTYSPQLRQTSSHSSNYHPRPEPSDFDDLRETQQQSPLSPETNTVVSLAVAGAISAGIQAEGSTPLKPASSPPAPEQTLGEPTLSSKTESLSKDPLPPSPLPTFTLTTDDDVKDDKDESQPLLLQARKQREQQPPPLISQNSKLKPVPENTSLFPTGYDLYPVGPDGKRDFSKSPAQLNHPDTVFDSDMTICYRDMSVKLQLPSKHTVTNVITPLVDAVEGISSCGESFARQDFWRIKDVSGVIRPGTMTLVISGPGEGRSSYLRALSNRIKLTSGRVVYNGRDFKEAEKENVDLVKATVYCDQVDVHFGMLTVYETIQFAHQMTSINHDEQRIDDTIALLGLEECRDTIVGDALIRGVSGGQKKRITIAESLVSDCSTFFLDEYSNGLDASTAEDIGKGLRKFCQKYNNSIVATLQQPTPELLSLFDRMVVLREGQVVFDGPVVDAVPYFAAMGFKAPDDVDTADFLIDCLSQPRSVIFRQQEKILRQKQPGYRSQPVQPINKPKTIDTSYGPIQVSPTPCITTEEMREFYLTTPQWREIEETLDQYLPKAQLDEHGRQISKQLDLSQYKTLLPTENSKKIYGLGYRLPIIAMLGYVCARQAKAIGRNTFTITSRILSCILMNFVYGSLYWNIKPEEQILRLAASVIALTQVAFANFVEISQTNSQLPIIRKQLAARFYPPWMYTFSTWVVSLPMSIIESTLFNIILYFMVNNYPGAEQWFSSWSILICVSISLSSFFRFLAVIGGDEQTSQSLGPPFIGVMMVFGGLFVTKSSLNPSISWLYWVSPFSWASRALTNVEFGSPRYDQIVNTSGEPRRIGDIYLGVIDMMVGKQWILWGCLYLLGFSFLSALGNALLVHKSWYEESLGTKRTIEDELVEPDPPPIDTLGDEVDEELLKQQIQAAAVQQTQIAHPGTPNGPGSALKSIDFTSSVGSSAASSHGSKLQALQNNVQFVPAWISFANISYSIMVKKDGKKVSRTILHNINGYAQPGKMLALMGSSGAGKTTLLDVIAGLKNVGTIEGSVLVNGQRATKTLLSRVSGYVEQFHTLYPYETVRETLIFAARLRLPRAIPDDAKLQIVDEIIDILELSYFKDYLIGNAKVHGLSQNAAKRVSIAVELLSNPPILFLDEPTTGLDSRSAQIVMKVVKRIARSGRAIICTIHQPSSELFFLFDRLLLLGAGGYQIYFGDLGYRGKTFVQYLSRCPGINPIKPHVNPASWMLNELGVGVTAEKGDALSRLSTPAAEGRITIEDEPEWADLEPAERNVRRFNKMYLMSDWNKRTKHRLEILSSIEIIDPSDDAGMARHKEEVEMVQMKTQNYRKAHNKRQRSENWGPDDEDALQLGNTSQTTLPTTSIILVSGPRASILTQFLCLYARNFSGYWRNRGVIYYRLIAQTIISLIFGWIYFNMKATDLSSAMSLIGAIFMAVQFSSMISTTSGASVFGEGKPTFLREKAGKYYLPPLWALCQFTIEMVWTIPSLIVTVVICYFMIGLKPDTGVFFSYMFFTYLLFLSFISWAMITSALTPSKSASSILMGAIMGITNGLAGIAITRPHLPRGWYWLHIILPLPHILEALIIPQLKDNSSPMTVVQPDGSKTQTQINTFTEAYLGFDYGSNIWLNFIWVLCFFAVTHTIAYLAITFLNFSKR